MMAAGLAGQNDLELLGGVDMSVAAASATPGCNGNVTVQADPLQLTGIVNLDDLNVSAKAPPANTAPTSADPAPPMSMSMSMLAAKTAANTAPAPVLSPAPSASATAGDGFGALSSFDMAFPPAAASPFGSPFGAPPAAAAAAGGGMGGVGG